MRPEDGARDASEWSLAPLLALRAHEEERQRAEVAARLADAEWAARDMSERATRLRELAEGALQGGERPGAEVALAGRCAARRRQAVEVAATASARAIEGVRDAERAWLRARAARQALERALAAWAAARVRAREAAEEASLDDAYGARTILTTRAAGASSARSSDAVDRPGRRCRTACG